MRVEGQVEERCCGSLVELQDVMQLANGLAVASTGPEAEKHDRPVVWEQRIVSDRTLNVRCTLERSSSREKIQREKVTHVGRDWISRHRQREPAFGFRPVVVPEQSDERQHGMGIG
jgi:hypothetical protein